MTGPDLDRVLHCTLLGDALVSAEVAVLLADETGRYVAANDGACRLTGYDRIELTGFRAGELAGDGESARIYERLTRGRLEGRKVVRCKDGRLLSCRYQGIRTKVARYLDYFILLLRPHADCGDPAAPLGRPGPPADSFPGRTHDLHRRLHDVRRWAEG